MITNKIIFSVFRDEFFECNEKNHRSTILALNGIGIETTEVLGVYKGSSEKSIMVDLNHYTLDNVMTIARLFNQESILVVEDIAKLVFLSNDDFIMFGQLLEVTESEAKQNDCYTFVPSTNKYLMAI